MSLCFQLPFVSNWDQGERGAVLSSTKDWGRGVSVASETASSKAHAINVSKPHKSQGYEWEREWSYF